MLSERIVIVVTGTDIHIHKQTNERTNISRSTTSLRYDIQRLQTTRYMSRQEIQEKTDRGKRARARCEREKSNNNKTHTQSATMW